MSTPTKPNPKPLGSSSKPNLTKASTAAPAAKADDAAEALKKLETKTKAVNHNNIARVANSQLTSSDDKLHGLVSLKSGKPLEKFPSTSSDIAKLKLTEVDAMLSTLEADRSGKEDEKRERLRVQIGLKPSPA